MPSEASSHCADVRPRGLARESRVFRHFLVEGTVRARYTAHPRTMHGAQTKIRKVVDGGTSAAVTSDMGSDKRSVPQTYDDITRTTVPDPDSSARPTVRQEQQAREGFRAMDEHEQALASRVAAALGGMAIDVEVERETVTLRGQVADAAAIARAEELVGRVDGVSGVVNRLVVGR